MKFGIVGVDVSSWQSGNVAQYTHPVITLRRLQVNGSVDANFMTWLAQAEANPAVKVIGMYDVLGPGWGAAEARAYGGGLATLLRWCNKPSFGMLDLECGDGFAGPGDHSDVANSYVEAVAFGQPGFAGVGTARMTGYANSPDWRAGWPRRPDWLRRIVAGYSSVAPADDGTLIGWQYTDGDTRWPVPAGWPRSSAPFGACDHNVFAFDSGDAFAAYLTGGTAATDGQEDDNVFTTVKIGDEGALDLSNLRAGSLIRVESPAFTGGSNAFLAVDGQPLIGDSMTVWLAPGTSFGHVPVQPGWKELTYAHPAPDAAGNGAHPFTIEVTTDPSLAAAS